MGGRVRDKDTALDRLQTLVEATVGGAVADATSGAGHAERHTRHRRGAPEKGRGRDAVGDTGVKHETDGDGSRIRAIQCFEADGNRMGG